MVVVSVGPCMGADCFQYLLLVHLSGGKTEEWHAGTIGRFGLVL